MVELDAGMAARMALTQQQATMGMIKHAANMEKQLAEMISQTVTASNNGKSVDLYA